MHKIGNSGGGRRADEVAQIKTLFERTSPPGDGQSRSKTHGNGPYAGRRFIAKKGTCDVDDENDQKSTKLLRRRNMLLFEAGPEEERNFLLERDGSLDDGESVLSGVLASAQVSPMLVVRREGARGRNCANNYVQKHRPSSRT